MWQALRKRMGNPCFCPNRGTNEGVMAAAGTAQRAADRVKYALGTLSAVLCIIRSG